MDALASDPAAVARRLEAIEQIVRTQAAEIKAQAATIEAQAATSKAQAAEIKAQAATIEAQAATSKAQAATIKSQAAEIKQLREQLEEAQRQNARQAAPFRRRESKKIPDDKKKRPGRKPGHPGSSRAVPEHVDEHAEVPLNECPDCGGPVDDVQPIEQFVEEAPLVRPHVTRIVTYQGTCSRCGPVCSRHRLQMSEAKGAAKVHLGPRALALATAINKRYGVTLRTTCRLLHDMAGLRLTPGGLAQALQRVGRRVEGAYEQLIDDLRSRPAVFVDETSWYVGAPGHWLWTFTSDTTTVYRVEPSRGRAVVTETLGPEFAGMLVSDCLATYESVPYRKHKCIAHHLRAIAEARKRPDTPDPTYLDQWKQLFQAVTKLWRARPEIQEAEFLARRAALESWCDDLLAQERAQPGDVAIQNRIGKRRDDVLGCLHEPAAEPTNNRAERMLRPAVIARKLSCGNKTEAGKHCFEVLTSVATTCHQRGHELISWLASCLPLAATPAPVPALR